MITRSLCLTMDRMNYKHELESLLSRSVGVALDDAGIDKFWQEYQKISFYLQYIDTCHEYGVKQLDWKFLHESGQLCEWAYENLPEAKPYKDTPMFIDKGQKYDIEKMIKYSDE